LSLQINLDVKNISAKLAALPMVLVALLGFVACSLWSVYYSFTNSKSLPRAEFVGLAQYERLFSTPRWMLSVENIVVFGVCTIAFVLVLGFLLAVALDQKIRFENTFRTIFLYPFALSFIVTGIVWQWILNPDLGLQQLVRNFGFSSFDLNPLASQEYAIYALIVAGVWQGAGFVMVLMLAGMRGINQEIWKVARIDGIPNWRTYLFIVLPMMRGVIITALVIVAAGVVKSYDLVVALTNGGPGLATELPAKYVYDYMFGRANLGQALAAATVMLSTVLIILVPWAYLEYRVKQDAHNG